jgi:hypothetical protein
LYASLNTIVVFTLRKMKWVGHAARMGIITKAYNFSSENMTGGDHTDELGVDGEVILECILGKWSGKVWTACIWLRRAVVSTVMNFRVPRTVGNFLPECLNFSGMGLTHGA